MRVVCRQLATCVHCYRSLLISTARVVYAVKSDLALVLQNCVFYTVGSAFPFIAHKRRFFMHLDEEDSVSDNSDGATVYAPMANSCCGFPVPTFYPLPSPSPVPPGQLTAEY